MPRSFPFVSIVVDEAQRRELETVLPPAKVRTVLRQAVTVTTSQGRTQIDKRVRDEVNIKTKYTKRVIKAHPPRGGDDPVGVITISRESIPLIAYGPKFTKRGGAVVTISKQKGPLTYRHAFRATVKKAGTSAFHEGHLGAFARARHLPTTGENKGKGKLTPRGFAGRLAIIELMGPSVLSVLGEAGTTAVAREELAKLQGKLRTNIWSKLDNALGRSKADRPPTQNG